MRDRSEQRRPIAHFSCGGVTTFPPPPPNNSGFENGKSSSICQEDQMNGSFRQHRQPQNQQRPNQNQHRLSQSYAAPSSNYHGRGMSDPRSHSEPFSWMSSSREVSLPPAADELSSFSSNPNSLEASLYGSQHNHHADSRAGHNRSKKLPHSYVLSPPSPSRQHVPKRPRFEGLNVVESLIQNLFSCGCVQGVAGNIQPGGFASKPFASRGDNANGMTSKPEPRPSHGHVQRPHQQPALLNPPPKLRRMTLEEAGNDLDVTFMM